jgi:hypothetical protein
MWVTNKLNYKKIVVQSQTLQKSHSMFITVQMSLAEFPITGSVCLKLLPQLALYEYTWCYHRVCAKKFLVQLRLKEMSHMNTVYHSCFCVQFNCCDTFLGWVILEAVGSRAHKVQSTRLLEGSKEPPHQVRTGILVVYEAFKASWKTVILIYQLIYGYICMYVCVCVILQTASAILWCR